MHSTGEEAQTIFPMQHTGRMMSLAMKPIQYLDGEQRDNYNTLELLQTRKLRVLLWNQISTCRRSWLFSPASKHLFVNFNRVLIVAKPTRGYYTGAGGVDR